MTKAEAPASGRTEQGGTVHIIPFRVYYEDTDASGIVYHVNYLKFAERARTDMLRHLGTAQQQLMEKDGLAFAVRNCEIEFLAPARLDDVVEVHTRLLEAGGASLRLVQTVKRDGDDLARLRLRIACIDRAGRASRLPAGLRAALAPLVAPEAG